MHRWYDPLAGRWISEDPIGFAAGDANLYRYVGNEVTGAVDPSGLIDNDRQWDILYRQIPPVPLNASCSNSYESDDYVPKRWENAIQRNGYGNDPTIDEFGLIIGEGHSELSGFLRKSRLTFQDVSYGCGGLFAVRAGLPRNNPFMMRQVAGAVGFSNLSDALKHLRSRHSGNGLVGAVQQAYPYYYWDEENFTRGKPLPKSFCSVPLKEIDIESTSNFLSLLGTDKCWYWEWENGSGGIVKHEARSVAGLRQIDNNKEIVFVVIPGTPTKSPIPSNLLNGKE